jgi:hypothetical protein
MKRTVIAAALLLLFAGMSFPADGKFGLGIILGEPTGLSLKLKTSDTTAFDAGAAWSFLNPASFHIHGDFLFHNYNLFNNVEKGYLALYYGIGGRLKIVGGEGETVFGVRIPVGLCYEFEDAPIDLFFEVVPLLDIVPSTKAGIGGAVGVRYFF